MKKLGEEGYSMVEMMVVLAIIAAMASIGIPSFKAIVPRVRLNAETMVLSNEIALARTRAIAKSNDARITFHPDGPRPAACGENDCYTIDKFEGGAWASLGTTVLRGVDLFSVSGFTPTDTVLLAAGNGQVNVPLNAQAVLELRSPDGLHRKRILVEPTGRMTPQRWNGSAWIQD